jgi:ElaB/YqjD/DUF883 family membrane-anchored ribosome-binding protein
VDDSTEVIRQQMEETRTSLSDKLEILEQQVKDTVQEAKDVVHDSVDTVKDVVHETVDTVKDAVHDTVDTVKETFDISRQFQRHPWAMLGGSMLLGFLGAKLLERSEPDRPRAGDWPHTPHWSHGPFTGPNGDGRPPHPGERAAAPPNDNESPDGGLLSSLTSQFGPELHKLKGMAVGAALGVVRDIISESIPEQLKPQVADVMDSVTVKLGGAPVRGPLLPKGDSNEKCNPAKMGRAMGPT